MAKSDGCYGLDMAIHQRPLGFSYGNDVTGPMPEIRRLDQIRASLRDPHCEGPEEVYAIAMDVARMQDREELKKRMLLFGVVTYAAGRLGKNRFAVRDMSIASASTAAGRRRSCMKSGRGKPLSTCKSTWRTTPDAALRSSPGREKRYWYRPAGACHHFGEPDEPLTFGAWCDREYGFEYDAVRARKGLARYPPLQDEQIIWLHNSHYIPGRLQAITPAVYGVWHYLRASLSAVY